MNVVLYFQSQSKTNALEKLAGVQEVAAKLNWLVQPVEGIPPPAQMHQLFDFWNPIGVIVECGGTAAVINPAVFGTLPIVFFDHDPSCLPKNTFCVTHDSAATGRMAARELMMDGITAFAFVPYPERRFWSDERERGFTDALRINGHTCRVFSGHGSASDPTLHQRELRAFLAGLPKPCALFAANDKTATEVLTAAAITAIPIPTALAVVGVDNAEEICEHSIPTLTSVKPDFREGGRLAAFLLEVQLRNGADFAGPRRRTFGPLRVVRRASTRRTAIHDRIVSDALELIRREACQGITAATVLKSFPCARRQAEIRFRKATGHSVLEEIHAVRIKRAKQLLEDSTMPLKVISDFCGFANPNSLRKQFRKETGLTLSEWRAQGASLKGRR
ncbi:MAG: substrate-binding domain-containing protein [Kiritimatiellae bacterium]|nr:substrate-binding domain-containing protein [Kiritimatiellia bacterium]